MEGDGETMGLVANELDQMQHRRMVIEHDGISLLDVDVENLFALRNGCEGLVDDRKGFEGLGRSMELPQAAVDQYQAGHRFLFLLEAFVASRDNLPHRCE